MCCWRPALTADRSQPPCVAICIPSGATVHADFSLCLATMVHGLGQIPLGLCPPSPRSLRTRATWVVDFANEIGAEFLLFIDSDIIFPRDALQRLLARDVDVVGATYSRRTPPLHALGKIHPQQPADAPLGLVLMNACRQDSYSLRTRVFEELRRPFFRFRADESSGTNVSEDYDFAIV